MTVNGRWLVERQPSVEMVVLGAAAERVEEVVGSWCCTGQWEMSRLRLSAAGREVLADTGSAHHWKSVKGTPMRDLNSEFTFFVGE